MLHIAFWGVGRVDPNVTSTCHVVALPNTYCHLHNEYVYHTNSMQRSRGKIWKLSRWFIFSPCSTARRYTKSAQIFNITSQANASSNERTQWDRP